MSGFTDMFGSGATQALPSFDLGNALPKGQTAAAGPVQPAVAKTKAGGVGGFLYNNIVQPFASGVSNLTSDIAGAGGAALEGIHGNPTPGMASAYLNSTPVGQAVNAQTGGLQKVEAGVGSIGSDVINAAAPVLGAEEFAGKVGLKALMGAGAKVGAKLGAAGGAANEAQQGASGGDVLSGAVSGGVGGALTGATGGAIARGANGIVGKLSGKTAAADQAGAGSSAATGNQTPNGILNNATTKAGAKAGQDVMAQRATDFAGATPTDIKSAMSYDKSGNPVGLRQVGSYLRGLNMPEDAQNMENAHGFMTGVIGGNLQDATNGVIIDASGARQVGASAVQDNLGKASKSGATGSAADVALGNVRQATANLTTNSTVQDTLGAISKLEQSQSTISKAVAAGDPKAAKENQVYQATIDHLNGQLNSSKVNEAVQNFKVSPALEAQIKQDAVENGVSPEMAQHSIDTLDNAKSYDTLRSAMQPAVVAGKLSRVAKETFANSVPQASSKGSSSIPSWELAMAATGHPGYALSAAARLAQHGSMLDHSLAKVNPGAYNAGREAALAPDALTARKLATPGGGAPSNPVTEATNPSAQAPTPVPTAPGATLAGSTIPLAGAATAETAAQTAQGNATPPVAPGAATGVGTSSVDQAVSQAAQANNPQPTLDASTIPGGTLQDLEREIQADPKNATTYKSIYDEAQKQVAASAPQKLNATEAKNLTNIQNATAALHNYVQGLNSLNDATRGAGVGQLSALLGKVGLGGANGNTAAQLESNKEELAIQLAQAMNNGNKPQGQQIQEIKQMLPSVSDPKALAARKIDQLATNLGDYLGIATGASVSNRSSGNTSSLLSQLTGGQ